MRTINKFLWLRNFTAFSLMVAVFAATSLVASAAPEKNASMGELIVSGSSADGSEPSVTLNGEKAISGRTFFSSGTISTTESTTATIKLGTLGSVSVAPNSVLSLSFGDNTINGTISTGQVKVNNAEGVIVNILNVDGLAANNLGGGVYDANANASRQDDDDSVSDGSQLALVLVFAGVVGGTVIYLLTRDSGPSAGTAASPVR